MVPFFKNELLEDVLAFARSISSKTALILPNSHKGAVCTVNYPCKMVPVSLSQAWWRGGPTTCVSAKFSAILV